MRFVIHYHQTHLSHYDLMIERETSLASWQIEEDSLQDLLMGKRIISRRIDDHRKEYLSYEGPISCDRGRVSIYDSGSCVQYEWSDTRIEVSVKGEILFGTLIIMNEKKRKYSIEYHQVSA